MSKQSNSSSCSREPSEAGSSHNVTEHNHSLVQFVTADLPASLDGQNAMQTG